MILLAAYLGVLLGTAGVLLGLISFWDPGMDIRMNGRLVRSTDDRLTLILLAVLVALAGIFVLRKLREMKSSRR